MLTKVKSLLSRRGLLVNGVLGALLLVGAVIAYVSLQGSSSADTTGRTARVTRGTVVSSVSAAGAAQSANSRSLSFGTSGTVDTVKVQVGDKVTKGQVLATLDDASARDSVTAAKAALDAAAGADTSTASGYSSYVSAKNTYNQAERQLAGTVLKAPFAGTIIAVNGTVGGSSSGSSSSSSSSTSSSSNSNNSNSSNSGSGNSSTGSSSSSSSSSTGFITLAQPKKLQVKGTFTESDVTKIKKGQRASVTFDALPGTSATGKVTEIDQTSTTANNVVQYGVTVTLSDVPSTVRIGATATVKVTTSQAQNALVVPTAAVRTAGGQSTVTVLRNGKKVTRTVQVGIKGDQGVEIKSGLNEGDQVVIAVATTGTGNGFPGRTGFGGGIGGTRRGGGGG